MRIIAESIVASLDNAQKSKVCFSFEDLDRKNWYYTPTDHGGLPLCNMTSFQHRLVHSLVSAGLSISGYNTVAAIMGLDNILDNVENFKADFGRERGRDPTLYYLSIFGSPTSSDLWGWRFGGHHVSLNYTLNGQRIISVTPSFFGADPADSPLLGPHMNRPLAGAEDLGRELFKSLGEQTGKALISEVPPVDLVSGNRSGLTDGDKPMHLLDLWRGNFDGDIANKLKNIQDKAEQVLNISDKHLEKLSFSRSPKGLGINLMTLNQREILHKLIKIYLYRLPDELIETQENILKDDLKYLRFAWAGSSQKYNPHYYRIQGKRIFIEYDNTQRDSNHIHTVWRDLKYDFGGDVLKRHYREKH